MGTPIIVLEQLRNRQPAARETFEGGGFRVQIGVFASEEDEGRRWADLEDELGAIGEVEDGDAVEMAREVFCVIDGQA